MPWKASSVMEERLRFVARLLDGEAMTDVCREFGISRKTGYKVFDRYKEHGLEALCDRSRRPVRYANQLPQPIASLIVRLKGEKPLVKIVTSLGTQSLKEAQDRRWPLVHEWRERFKRTLANVPLTLAEIEAEAHEVYTSLLEQMAAEAKRGKHKGDAILSPDGERVILTPEQAAIDAARDDAVDALTQEDWEAASVKIAAIERRKGVKLDPASETYARLARAILTAQIEAMSGRLRMLRGDPIKKRRKLSPAQLAHLERVLGFRPSPRDVADKLEEALLTKRLRYIAGKGKTIAGYYPYALDPCMAETFAEDAAREHERVRLARAKAKADEAKLVPADMAEPEGD